MARVPWWKARVDLAKSEKLARLPDDAARWAWVGVLGEAKTQRRMGVFAGRAHLVAAVAGAGPYVEDYVAAGLLHVAPVLCADCARRHVDDDLQSGDLVVHDYRLEQRDPSNADRQDAFRAEAKLRALTVALEEAGVDVEVVLGRGRVTRPSVTSGEEGDLSTPGGVTVDGVTPAPTPIANGKRNGKVTADSRARGTTVTVTETETTTREKKNGLDEEIVDVNGVEPRELADEAPFLTDLNRAGRRGASIDRPLVPPPGLAAATPGWRLPCSNYSKHQSKHLIIDGLAVCPPCEEAAGFDSSTSGEPGAASSLWGSAL